MFDKLLKEIADIIVQYNRGLITDVEALRTIVATATTQNVLENLDKE